MKLYDEEKNIKSKDLMKEPLFFGSGKNIQRYDIMKYDIFYKIGENMDENFWKASEIDLSKDVVDFKKLLEEESRISTLNTRRQIVLDSIQGRSPLLTFGRVCTNSAFEYALTRLQYQETNHSDVYSYILRNVYDDPSEVFDTILEDEIIVEGTKSITEAYEKFYELIAEWEINGSPKKGKLFYKLKKALWLSLISWNILEGIRFFVSFACTFSFAENKKMNGSAQELKLIARDEIIHLQLTQKLINILKSSEEEGFLEVIEDCREEVGKLYAEAAQAEIEWGEYLFRDGSIIGLNSEILTKYIQYITNQRLKAIREPKMFDITQNPLPWMDHWLGKGREEVLPQEIEITDYKIGAISDINDGDWDDLF